MRRVSALFLFLLVLLPDAHAARRRAVAPPSFDVPAADEAAARALDRGVPGLAIAVRKGNLSFSRGYGFYDRDENIPAWIHHEWQAGSVTKQFTAAAVMRLMEMGLLNTTDRVREWVPELDSRYDAVTIEQLLTHTSGMAEYTDKLESAWLPMTQHEVLSLINADSPSFAAGDRFMYSNAGYFVLGMIVERASSKTYAELLQELFFEPLGMTRTSYCGSRTASPHGYFLDGDEVIEVPAADSSLTFSAGGICSTANDLVRWTAALANGSAVSPESYARMTTAVDPRRTGPVAYGYGLALTALDGRRRIWHNGHVLGFQSHVAYFPNEDLTIVVLVNLSDLDVDHATLVAEEIARALR